MYCVIASLEFILISFAKISIQLLMSKISYCISILNKLCLLYMPLAFGCCPSIAFLPVLALCANARGNRLPKKILIASPLENWRRPPGRPRTRWMKTIQHDLKPNNLSLNKAIYVAQNCPLWSRYKIVLTNKL